VIRRSLELLARVGTDGRTELRAPAVGIYGDHPREGEGLVPGSRAGTLVVLGRTIDLLVPQGTRGDVLEVVRAGTRAVPVAFGDTLLVLAPRAASGRAGARGAGAHAAGASTGRAGQPSDGLAVGEHALTAPTSGVFYGRPDPASPPFIAPGARLEQGQTAGLIEVMKCFSPIVHPGGALPSPAVVVRVLVQEGQEVSPGQILAVLRSA
jgi:acetyl-CoA carboxylase biotin carboxyl carrier protein